MIIFLLFIYFWLGISSRYSPLLTTLLILPIFLITSYRYKRNIALICLASLFVGVGVSYIRFDYKKSAFQGFVVDSHDNYFILNHLGEKLYLYNKENNYEIGDYINVTGTKKELDFTTIESQFDFKDYLNKKGVYYELEIEHIDVKFSNPIRIRERREKFLSHFDESTSNLISAFLFSTKYEDSTIGDINKLHLARLANATGVFIYAYLHLFSFILAYFIKNKRIRIVSLISLLPYIIFTFPRFAVLRIVVMELFRYINENFIKRKFYSLEMVGIVGFFFLLIDYHLGYQMSFILGFTLPVMITFIRDAMFRYKKIKGKIALAIMTYIYLIPFELKFYNGINPLSLVLQVLLTPLFIFVAVISLLCFYGIPFYQVVNVSSKGLSNLLGWLSKISFQINAPPMYSWMIVIYVFLFLAFCYYKNINFVPIHRFISAVFLMLLALYLSPVPNLVTEQVSFINVGQGDSCLIRKGKTAVLIDTGGLSYIDVAKESLIPYLQKQRIYRLDMVITTHDDFDHCGALDSLKENFYVKNVVTNSTDFPINIGGITFNNYNNHITEYSEENDKSLVIGFRLCHKDFLIMGDAPVSVENNMMNEYEHIDCDILKAGHHGSKTSTSEEFIKYLKPTKAIISCGKNNRYGHPHASVIKTLETCGVEILRTDQMGTITYKRLIT